MDDKDGPPSAKALDEGYNQTYLIMSRDFDKEAKDCDGNDVFFSCGNWCYKGLIQFNGININTEELPVLIPALQKQQGSLRYFCNAKSIPVDSDYAEPLQFLEDAVEFLAQEIMSESVDKELRKMSNVFPWIDDNTAQTYFELTTGNLPEYMKSIALIASKTYTQGLILISIYFERVIYLVVQSGEGDQPLLDVRFPDVSKHGQGLHINSYNDHTVCWRKLTLWHNMEESSGLRLKKEIPKIRTVNVSSKNYEQTYCILKSSWDPQSSTLSVHHDALFRFGSWCYSGRVQLTPTLSLSDIPYVIPALRMQQSRLDFLCDVSAVPTTSPFAFALEYVQQTSPLIEEQIIASQSGLQDLIDRLTNMGLGDSVTRWIEGDPANSFFEFKLMPDEHLSERFRNVELIVSKCYHASGIVTIIIIFQFTVYVTLLEAKGENPLLDSKFPDISGKGRGYQLQGYSDGIPDWPTLRKVSIWQTVSALEQEFRDKAAEYAQAKNAEHDKELDREDSLNTGNRGAAVTSTALICVEPDAKRSSPETAEAAPAKADDKACARSSALDTVSLAADSKSAVGATSDAVPRRVTALPHHVPKLDSLSKRMDDIRRNMGDEGMKAPWDMKGRPVLGKLSESK